MKRFLIIVLCIAAIAYVAWPAFSMYQLYSGVKGHDEPLVERKVNWTTMRASFKEAIRPKVLKEINRAARKSGSGIDGALMKQMSASAAPQIVDLVVDQYMTPKGLILLAETGGEIKLASGGLRSLLGKLAGSNNQANNADSENKDSGLGGFLRKAEGVIKSIPGAEKKIQELTGAGSLIAGADDKSSKASSSRKPVKYGWDNVKRLRFNTLTELELAIAKNPKARKADLTAIMAFEDFDWKLVKIIPKL